VRIGLAGKCASIVAATATVVLASIGCGSSGSSGSHASGGAAGAPGDAGTDSAQGGTAGMDGGQAGSAGADAGTDAATEAGTDAGSGPALGDFCSAFVDHWCTWFAACRGGTCTTDDRQYQQLRCADLLSEVTAGRLGYLPAQAQKCLDSFDPNACGFFYDRPTCAAAFPGKQAISGNCYDYANYKAGFGKLAFDVNECAHGYCSDNTCTCAAYASLTQDCSKVPCDPTSAYCGSDDKCHALAPANGSCEPGGCAPGYVCTSQQCLVANVPLDGACQATEQCRYGDVCNGGKCKSVVGAGDACVGTYNCPNGTYCGGSPTPTCANYSQLHDDCTTIPCDPNAAKPLYCDPTQKCAAAPQPGDLCGALDFCAVGWCADTGTQKICRAPGATGDDCSDTDPSASGMRCQSGLSCVPTGLDSNGVATGFQCEPPGAQGDYCNGPCQSGLYCDINNTRTCLPRLSAGKSCFGSSDCQDGLYCKFDPYAPGTCAAVLANGQACKDDDNCASGYCDSASSQCAKEPAPTPPAGTCVAPPP
jgi:hypothetical protein